MASNEWVAALLEMALASAAGIVLVLLARRPLQRLAGWRAVYLSWALVPLAVVAVLLPARVRMVDVVPVAADAGVAADSSVPLHAAAASDWAQPLVAAWVLGAALCVVLQWRQQRRFARALGNLAARVDGLWQAQSVAGLPAVVGVRGRIVVPADFDRRYTPEERALILAHERVHVRRGDIAANAIATALRCLLWFNPLMPLAVDRFRRDQELACDEAVVAMHPASRRAYGEAMLKNELSRDHAPFACQWSTRHPLKERVAMLASANRSPRQRLFGAVFSGALVLVAACATWAAQPAKIEARSAAAPGPTGIAGASELRNRNVTIREVEAPVQAIASRVAQQVGLRFEGEIPDPTRKATLIFESVPVLTVLAILGAETKSEPRVENGVLRFVPVATGAPVGVAEPSKPSIDLRMRLVAGNRTVQPSFVVGDGETFRIVERPEDWAAGTEYAAKGYTVTGTATLQPSGDIRIDAEVRHDGMLVGSPAIAFRQGTTGTLRTEGPAGTPPMRLEVDASLLPASVQEAGAPRG